jgi:IclR family acetate operon transcriptional repressor
MERAAERNTGRTTPDAAVARVSAVLGAFDTGHADLRVAEISRRAGLPMSTTSRLIAELVAYGLLHRTGASLRLGDRLVDLGRLAARRRHLLAAARPHLGDLREATGQAVSLVVLDGHAAVTVDALPAAAIGQRQPAHACAGGKALLAWAGDATVGTVTAGPMAAPGPRTITSPGVLRRQLARIRADGLAYDCEESASGTGGVAAVVPHPGRPPAAAIAVTGPAGALQLCAAGPAVRAVVLAVARDCGPPACGQPTCG